MIEYFPLITETGIMKDDLSPLSSSELLILVIWSHLGMDYQYVRLRVFWEVPMLSNFNR